jgi:hypothetical protein
MLHWILEFLANITICVNLASFVPLLHDAVSLRMANLKEDGRYLVSHKAFLAFGSPGIPIFEVSFAAFPWSGRSEVKEYHDKSPLFRCLSAM